MLNIMCLWIGAWRISLTLRFWKTTINSCVTSAQAYKTLRKGSHFLQKCCESLPNYYFETRILIKSLPDTLIVHLKRFKYDDTYKRMVKLTSKVAFPLELRVDAVKTNFLLYMNLSSFAFRTRMVARISCMSCTESSYIWVRTLHTATANKYIILSKGLEWCTDITLVLSRTAINGSNLTTKQLL